MASYTIETPFGTVDLDQLTEMEWGEIKALQEWIYEQKEFKSVCQCSVAAFVAWMGVKSELATPYNPETDCLN